MPSTTRFTTNNDQGLQFSDALMREIESRFHYVDHDINGRERLFFDSAGGSFRLKSATEAFARIDTLPDCPERIHALSLFLQMVQAEGTDDVRSIFNARGGSMYASLKASFAMFDMVRAVTENIPGTNMVTSILEHPSSFDATSLYAQRTDKEWRVARSNPVTDGIDVDEIVGLIDLQKTPVDGINIAPYKFFGSRDSGLSWLSGRAATLPHHKLAGKKKDFWDLGSSAPWQFAVVTGIVNCVCWLGRQFIQSGDRRGAASTASSSMDGSCWRACSTAARASQTCAR